MSVSAYLGKRLTDLVAVDEALRFAALARNKSENDFLQALRSFWMDFPSISQGQLDPHSADYANHWFTVYEALAGKKYEIKSEGFEFDVEYYSSHPYPFCTESPQVVSQHIMAIGHIIGALSLPPKASILEMGAGWGNTSLILAQMGYDVTVVDINRKYGELIRNRSHGLGVNIQYECLGFDEVLSLGKKFDCVLFFESFHHSHDHLKLLDIVYLILNSGGILALAGEPLNERLPYEWGLNPAGEALWQIRTHGWLELVFRESYLLKTLQIKGFSVQKHEMHGNPVGTTFVCERY